MIYLGEYSMSLERNVYPAVDIYILYMSVISNWFIVLLKSSNSLLTFYMVFLPLLKVKC